RSMRSPGFAVVALLLAAPILASEPFGASDAPSNVMCGTSPENEERLAALRSRRALQQQSAVVANTTLRDGAILVQSDDEITAG
ncbi:hypothetical protein OVW19_30135, partial [Klebsiella pneumoniae]|uniref:hypothetical protein n=1 Tax=Klebsiella pneumoniae TaxID=573 RepID=UPI0022710E27